MLWKKRFKLFILSFIGCGVCFALVGVLILFPLGGRSNITAKDVFSPAPPPSDILIIHIKDESMNYGCFAIYIDYESAVMNISFIEKSPTDSGKQIFLSPNVLSDIIDICGGTIYTEDNKNGTAFGRDVLSLLAQGKSQSLANIAALILKRLISPENSHVAEEMIIRISENGNRDFSLVSYKQKQSFLENIAVHGNVFPISAAEFIKIIEEE